MLSYNKITDEGMQHLNGLNQLRRLSLAEFRVTDKGIEHLKNLVVGSEMLSVGEADITDAGLIPLRGLTNSATPRSW